MQWILFLIMLPWAFAHQTSLTSGGKELFWPNQTIPIYIGTNTSDLSPSTVTNIILNSMNEWNSTGVVNISSASASNNQVQFLSDFSIYGSSVIGVTEISYNTSGAISKAVILLNDSYNFTSQENSFADGSVFLGDVVTHELGHLFGLSHSEVLEASMFYTSFPGQSTISADDRSGLLHKYGGSQGSIHGKVKGGNQIGVLGVHVQAISRRTTKSVGVITDEWGYFNIEGLDLDDSYYIYTSPVKNIESLPGYFSNLQNEFCPGTYVGSFFSACGREYEGFPREITLRTGSEIVDVGVITINCGLKANEDYSYQKLQASFAPLTIWHPEEGSLMEKAFVGYFREMASSSWSSWETLNVDLTGVATGIGTSLQVNFLAHPFGNLLEYEMRLLQNGSLVESTSISNSVLLGTYNTDMKATIPLSLSSSSNFFEIEIRARKMANSMIPLTFPSPTLFASDSHLPYLLMLNIWQFGSPLFNTPSYLSDNESCLDAPFTYKVSKSKALSEKITASKSDAANAVSASCGTINPPGSGGPGPSMPLLVLGFALAILTGHLAKKSKYFLS